MSNEIIKKTEREPAVIFDLDGTLWDSTATIHRAWQEAARHYGFPLELRYETVLSLMGKTIAEIRDAVFGHLGAEEAELRIAQVLHYEIGVVLREGGSLYPHVEDCLRALSRNNKLMIVSNCGLGYIEAFLDYSGLGRYFCDFESNGGTGLEKGENLRLIMDRNGIEKAIYVGDTDGDRRAALVANIPFVHAAYGFARLPEDGVDAVIGGLSELPAVAARFLSGE